MLVFPSQPLALLLSLPPSTFNPHPDQRFRFVYSSRALTPQGLRERTCSILTASHGSNSNRFLARTRRPEGLASPRCSMIRPRPPSPAPGLREFNTMSDSSRPPLLPTSFSPVQDLPSCIRRSGARDMFRTFQISRSGWDKMGRNGTINLKESHLARCIEPRSMGFRNALKEHGNAKSQRG